MAIKHSYNLDEQEYPEAYFYIANVSVEEDKMNIEVYVYSDATSRENNENPVDTLTYEVADQTLVLSRTECYNYLMSLEQFTDSEQI